MVITGGQSREGLGSVLVTPGGDVVGTAFVSGGSGTSRSQAQTSQANAQRAESARRGREASEQTAKAFNLRRDLSSQLRDQLGRRDLDRGARLRLKQDFQAQTASIERQKFSNIASIRGGGSATAFVVPRLVSEVRQSVAPVDTSQLDTQQLSRLSRLNRDVSRVTTKPAFEFFKEQTGVDLVNPQLSERNFEKKLQELKKEGGVIGSIAKFVDEVRTVGKRDKPGDLEEFAEGVSGGFFKGVRDEPATTVATFGVGFGVGKTLPFITKVLAKIKGGTTALNAFKLGLPLIFFGQKGVEIAQQEDARAKGEVVGRSLAVEVVPFFAGARVGRINLKTVERLNKVGNKLTQQRNSLALDKRGKATTSSQKKTKQVQVKKSEKKVKLTKDSLKNSIKRASNEDVKAFRNQRRGEIDRDNSLSSSQKLQRKLLLDALILEAKTGTRIITESGKVDFKSANEALIKLQSSSFKQPRITGIKPLASIRPTTPKERNEERIRVAREKEQLRRENANKPIGQRNSLASKPAVLSRTSTSSFAGLGLYERTDTILVNRIGQLNAKSVTSQVDQSFKSRQLELLGQRRLINTSNAVSQLNRQLSLNKTAQQSLTRQINASASETLQKTKQQQLNKLKTNQQSLQKLKLKLRTIQKTLQRGRGRGRRGFRPRFRRPFRPIKPLLFPKLPKKKAKKGKVVTKIGKGNFQVFTRKNLKDRKIKTFKTKRKAQVFLRRRLANTLRASGFIVDKKTKKKIRPIVKSGFRLAKRDKFRLVERRNKRLDTSREVRKIQQARLKSTKLIRTRRKK